MDIDQIIKVEFGRVHNQVLSFRPNNLNFQVFPEIFNDKKYAAFQTSLMLSLHDAFPDLDWSPLLTIPGLYALPTGNPSSAILFKVPDKLKLILSTVCKMACRRAKPTAFSIKRTSNTSWPYFVSSLEVKRDILDCWLSDFESILSAIEENKAIDLVTKFKVPIGYAGSMGVRGQNDSYKLLEIINNMVRGYEYKVRNATLQSGETIQVDKRPLDVYPQYMSRKRARQIYKISMVVNQILIPFFKAAYEGMLDKWSPTFKISILYDSLSNMSDHLKYPLKADFKEFDKHLWEQVTDIMLDSFGDEGIHPSYIKHMKSVLRASYLMAPDFPPYKKASWDSSPLDIFNPKLGRSRHHGMTSGFAGVAVMDKLFMVSIICYIMAEMGELSIEPGQIEVHIDRLLSGEHKGLRILNMGDDNFMKFASDDMRKRFISEGAKLSPDLEFDLEGISFLGRYIYTEKGSGRSYDSPNLVNGVANIISPEFPISTERRQHFGFGIRERNKYYLKNAHWHRCWGIVNSVFREYYHSSIDDMVNDMSKEYNQLPAIKEAMSILDLEFILNPDAIFYKMEASDINQDLLKLYYLSLPDTLDGYILEGLQKGDFTNARREWTKLNNSSTWS